ncbi:MAG: hypothetical protein EBZ59_01890, partial [Planctomycetia bacterium]|nr:hypothetical protein [Planctomycetia bacterium]
AGAADAASLAVAGCFASAAVIGGLVGRCSAIASLAAGGICWAAVALAAFASCTGRRPAPLPGGRGRPDGLRPGILPVQGPLRRALVRASMVSSAVGMVAWLFLDPDRAGLYPLLASAWFVALAVPRAALLDGVGESAAWRRLFRSAAGGPDRRLPLESLRRPGPARAAAESTLSYAAILGWPPLVAGALEAGDALRGWPCLAVALALAAAAMLVAVAATAAEGAGASGESLQAALLAAAVSLVVFGAVSAATRRFLPPGVAAPSPSPPLLPDRHSRRPVNQPDVEQTVGSCQTSFPAQPLPASAVAGRARFLNGLRRECGAPGTIEEVQVVTAVTAPPFFQGGFSCTDKM